MLYSDMFAGATRLRALCSSYLAAPARTALLPFPGNSICLCRFRLLRSSSVVDPPMGDAIPTVRDAAPTCPPRTNQRIGWFATHAYAARLAAQEVFQNEHLH